MGSCSLFHLFALCQIQPSSDGWIADNKVPQGWKHKTTLGNNKTLVYSPAGESIDPRE
jgi:hypothetical protein